MTLYVPDSSIVVEALTSQADLGRVCRHALIDAGDLIAPSLLDAEVLNSVRGLVRGGRFPASRADLALDTLARMPIERFHIIGLLRRIWELRANMTAYDASYVALAEATNATILTTDEKILNIQTAIRRCPVRLINGKDDRIG